jgi:hypothetical protein
MIGAAPADGEQYVQKDGGWSLLDAGGGSQWDDVTGGINYADGNVGIGTTPVGNFHVAGTGVVTSTTQSTDSYAVNYLRSAAGLSSYSIFTTADVETARIQATDDSSLLFSTGSSATEAMRIDSSGSVGIGTNAPAEKFVVSAGSSDLGLEVNPNYQGRSYVTFADRGDAGAYSPAVFRASDCQYVTQAGLTMTLDTGGNVKINTGNLELSNGGGWYQSDASWVRSLNDKAVYNANTTANAFTTPGDFTAGYSDMRLKTHLGTIPDALDKVCSLEGFYYERNDVAQSLGYQGGERRVGLSAQDVQAVLPEVVKDAPINIDNGTDYLTIDYERVVPLLVESIKDLRAEIAALRSELHDN